MLYFKVLRDGIADMPDASPGVRAGIEELARATGWRGVHDELARVDPESARRIHPNDPQRLQRALEVYRVSGRTMTELHEEGQKRGNLGPGHDFPLRFFAVEPESRATLHKKITDRFHDMLSMGLVAEVEKLYRREDLSIDLPSIRSVGYRQVWKYLSGHYDYDAMIERGIIATRQLAKRQLTWLRSWPALTGLGSRHEISLERLLNTVNADSI
jgi:tRNA dimethylallyltransferase